MLPAGLIADVNQVRTHFLQAVDSRKGREHPVASGIGAVARGDPEGPGRCGPSPGPRALRRPAGLRLHRLERARQDDVPRRALPRPRPARWLVTEKNDTTAQSLRIEYAEGPAELERVVVHSWSLDQIKLLVGNPAAREQNERDHIEVHYRDQEGLVVVDGTRASFPKADLEQFQFALKQELRPLPHPYTVPVDKLEDREFIRALTIKELPGKLSKGTVLSVAGESFNGSSSGRSSRTSRSTTPTRGWARFAGGRLWN